MGSPGDRFQKRMLDSVTKEMQLWIDEALKDAFDPARLTTFMKGLGINIPGLGGMAGKQSGLDPYQVMGLDSLAPDDQVRKRYRELLKKLHPDTSGVEGTGFLLQTVIAAYETIKRERGWLK